MHDNYYKTLGIHRDATLEEIHEAYRELERKYHPDLAFNDPEARIAFQEIQAAFDVLSNLEQREVYENTRRSDTSTEDVLRTMQKTRDFSATRPPSSAEHSGVFIVPIVLSVVILVAAAFFVSLSLPPGEEDAQQHVGTGHTMVGSVCCCGTPLILIVMATLVYGNLRR